MRPQEISYQAIRLYHLTCRDCRKLTRGGAHEISNNFNFINFRPCAS